MSAAWRTHCKALLADIYNALPTDLQLGSDLSTFEERLTRRLSSSRNTLAGE